MQENPQILTAKTPGNSTTVLQMQSGFVVLSQSQFLPGYCLLLAYPQVKSLNDLPIKQRAIFLNEMGLIGDAIQATCQPTRINYAILGNKDPFLHAHIIPRYDWESAEFKPLPTWRYPDETWTDPAHFFSVEKHAECRDAIRDQLKALMEQIT